MRRTISCCAVVFAVLALASVADASTATILYTFLGPNGANPVADLVQDGQGNLWGTTKNGGMGSCSCGTIFELTKDSGFTTPGLVYSFKGAAANDGAYPEAGLVFRNAGGQYILYGTTSAGGSSACGGVGCGTVFSFLVASFTEQVLYPFAGGSDGANPTAELLFYGKTDSLYGTTSVGGSGACAAGCGTVFALNLKNNKHTVLYPFTGGSDGANPLAGLVFDSKENLWGTAQNGGSGYGTVFELTEPDYKSLVLGHSFQGGIDDGADPEAALVFDKSANLLYGTTAYGGNSSCSQPPGGCGTVFQIPPQSPGNYMNFLSFTGLTGSYPGASPIARLALETRNNNDSGYLYGTASLGGSDDCGTEGCGTAFAICPPTICAGLTEYTLFSFNGAEDGANPAAGMLLNFPPLPDPAAKKRIWPPKGYGQCTTNCIGSAANGGGSGVGNGVIYALTD